jgi:hypothetical protein
MFKGKNKKNTNTPHSHDQNQGQKRKPGAVIAIILDDKVYDIMYTEKPFAALLLSNPKFVEITSRAEEKIGIGHTYNESDESFTAPEKTPEVPQ